MKPLKKLVKKSSLILILALVVGFLGKMTMGYFSEAVRTYTETLIINYSTEVIDRGVSAHVLQDLKGGSLIEEKYDYSGKVSYATLNAQKINLIKTNTSQYILDVIDTINTHTGFQTIYIPLGYFFGRNYFLANGIRVPVDLEVIGNQKVEIQSDVKSYGLNTTILEINLLVSLEIQTYIPFQSEKIVTESKIPLSVEIMNNDIPYYLGDLFDQS